MPRGYNWATWNADFFEPARPLLASAPWLFVRGNHEGCGRAAEGWRRLLDPGAFDAQGACDPFMPPFRLPLKGLALVSIDSSCASDDVGDHPGVGCGPLDEQVARFERWFAPPLFDGTTTWLLTHKPVWALANADDATPRTRNVVLQRAIARAVPAGLELAIGGHVHLFEVVVMQRSRPPQLVVGNAGTALDGHTPLLSLEGRVINEEPVDKGFAVARFGYALARPDLALGHVIEAFDVEGAPVAACEAKGGALACRPVGAPIAPAK